MKKLETSGPELEHEDRVGFTMLAGILTVGMLVGLGAGDLPFSVGASLSLLPAVLVGGALYCLQRYRKRTTAVVSAQSKDTIEEAVKLKGRIQVLAAGLSESGLGEALAYASEEVVTALVPAAEELRRDLTLTDDERNEQEEHLEAQLAPLQDAVRELEALLKEERELAVLAGKVSKHARDLKEAGHALEVPLEKLRERSALVALGRSGLEAYLEEAQIAST